MTDRPPPSFRIGKAYAAVVSPGGAELAIFRNDGSRVGITDLDRRSAEDLRRLADAIDLASGRRPGT